MNIYTLYIPYAMIHQLISILCISSLFALFIYCRVRAVSKITYQGQFSFLFIKINFPDF